MTAHVMVDMETAGTGPDAAILSAALVQFIPETGEIVSSFAVDIDLNSAVKHGGVIEPGIMQWWVKQSDTAREVFNSTDAVPFPLAMYSIQEWLDATGPAYVWSNGAGFDCVILRRALERLGYKAWPFCMDCDVRTMVMLGQQTGFDPKKDMPFEGTEHNALDDALHQVKYVSAIWQRLVGGA
ncbi:TPA: 3'-5' exoribonuclease [Escherichia coli O22:H16]|nr:3'-5' exoribonuclease [Escherichia coli O22:H16]HDQ6808598.1 3'-5' exoribonuclease [Escherichia coli O22:H16]HDQ6829297.1 3'-5' exoribonuclease [Escherichia coli O128:H2]